MNEKMILKELIAIKEKAIARYSQFKVGALLLTRDGKKYSGHNIESSSFGLTICAERVALFKALSEGEREFDKMFILSDSEKFCPPCGACRQVMMDFTPDISIVLLNNSGDSKTYLLKELLPNAFTRISLP
jgi:cytidine deaminase